jgi:D-sedoheptulose 7-phosphate isomerase
MKQRGAVRRRGASSRTGPLELQARTSLREASVSLARTERVCGRAVAAAAEVVIACLEGGGTVYFCGNGGSAADAQHMACELAGRFYLDRPALAALALTTNTSSLTAIGNDYSFDDVFSRQLEGLGGAGDVLVAISTSGGSANVMQAVRAARALGMTVIGMTGTRGDRFAAQCDLALVSQSAITPRIQESHVAMGHVLCELVERALFAQQPGARRAKKPAPNRPGRRAGTSRSSGHR